MRLFVGIELPKEIKDELFAIQKQFGSGLAKIKWVSKKNLHLSLKFLGEVKEKDIAKVKEKLEKIEFKSFKVKLSKIGVFPDIENIRVIFVGLLPEKKVINLQQKVDGELLDLFKFDQRFSPHLTLGRIKIIKKKKSFISKLKNISVNNKMFEISKFNLVKSVPVKDKHIYEVLESFVCKDNL